LGARAQRDAAAGDPLERGIRLAVDEQNARGGVHGRLVVLRAPAERGHEEEVALLAARLLQEEQVAVLVGEAAAPRSLALAPLADRHQVPLVTPSCADPRLTRDGERVRPWVFRSCAVDASQGLVMAGFARGTLKLQRVAVLREAGDDASVGMADAFLSRFKELGGEVLDDLSYRSGDTDFRPQLVAVRRKKPEAIYVPGAAAEVVLVARQARELGLGVPLLGGDGWDVPRLAERGGGALEGGYYTSHYSPGDPSPRWAEFAGRYRARYGVGPDALAARGYDAARVALEAIARAPDLGRAAIRDAIAATRKLPGVGGDISIGPDHGAVRPMALLRVQGDQAAFVEARLP
ncbi:MAG: ABC transporter substrate-binding protein, partial [Anaeromyxobacteraceae bacterium]|nr:ABC transporter substrate-binding protein [Anaeromyxobacteraceae bacterium]